MRFIVLLLATALALVPQANAPRDLTTEMDRIRAETAASTPDDQQASPVARLDRAKTALQAGRLQLALYLFEMPWESAKAWTFVKSSGEITAADVFVKKWTATGPPRPVAAPAGRRAPALVEALASIANARGPTTYFASRSYGEDAGVAAGLYYLGESHAAVQFAAMIRTLAWPDAGQAPALRSLAPELVALDSEMTTAYQTMERANHSTYIGASAALKQARTLNERGQYAGALVEYLLARYLFAPLRGPAIQDATAERIAAARAALPAGADHSVVELFLQLAEEGVAGNVPAQRRGAAAALEDVLPAYRAALAAPSTSSTASAPAQVTVTLVRWPFT